MQPEGIEHRRHAEMQERQLVETRAQSVIADRAVGVDALGLRKPRNRRAFVTDLVDELQLDRLSAGKDAAIGNAVERLAVDMPPILHHAAKPGVGVLYDRLERSPRLRAGRLKSVRGRLKR